jgi:adenylate cyclase
MLIKIGSAYLPALSLSMFLDHVNVPLEEVIVDWGKKIVIPANKSKLLDKDVVIPIDHQGMTFIPYSQIWGRDFQKMTAHTLLKLYDNADLRGNLREFFEDHFVFIGDISVGVSDIGQTPLEDNVPLVAIHAAVLNGLLTNTFYHQWSFWQVQGLIGLLSLLLGLAALPRAVWILYATGGVVLLGIIGLTWWQLLHFALLPIVTVSGSVLWVFSGLVVGLQIALARDQAFIRNAFTKYVPAEVVSELLARPESLQLGGEERVLSVLFADLENFTTIAESMSPRELVSLLNEYLTEMTAIILAHGGIIDKYEGDAIMAEFGAPLALPRHAELAVRAGLQMQRRLHELRQAWEQRGLPMLRCRVGISTGAMLVGNMGSHQVFDYTVIGDVVNLASRLEGANKLYCTYMMIAEATYVQLTPGMFRTRVLDVIKVKGKTRAIKVFEVYGEATEAIDPTDLLYYRTYHEAFAAYLERDFATARGQFAAALSLRPDDPASHNMLARMAALSPEALPDDWDGSMALTSK